MRLFENFNGFRGKQAPTTNYEVLRSSASNGTQYSFSVWNFQMNSASAKTAVRSELVAGARRGLVCVQVYRSMCICMVYIIPGLLSEGCML